MQLTNSFDVPAPPAAAWRLLNDVPRVVRCMPGAELTSVVGEHEWKATMDVKLGPISLQFLAEVTREVMDEEAGRVLLRTKAHEARGRGRALATIESTLSAAGSGTTVSIVTDLTLQGAVAQHGRGLVPDVAAQLTRRFAACVAEQLAGEADGGG